MVKSKILLIVQEMAPYTDLSEQSDFVRDLALKFQKKGNEIRVFMPKFGAIKERKHRLHEVIRLSGLNISVGKENNPLIIKVASLQTAKIQIYFLDNQDFFDRKEYFLDTNKKFFKDNDDRIVFFNKGVMELLVKLGWKPDIIHCHGWMSSLIPLYARTIYKNEPVVKDIKIIQSLLEEQENYKLGTKFHNKANYNGILDKGFDYLKNPGINEIFRTGINYSDGIILNSKTVSKNTQDIINKSKKPVLTFHNQEEEEFYDKYFEYINRV